jgi:hypothetical protein
MWAVSDRAGYRRSQWPVQKDEPEEGRKEMMG